MRFKQFAGLSALLLCLALLLAGCGGNGATTTAKPGTSAQGTAPGTEPGKDTSASWEDLAFDQTLRINVSVNQSRDVTYPAADRYIKGPDNLTQDEVLNKVYNRNRTVERDLALTVVYSTHDCGPGETLEVIDRLVSSADNTTPDIFNGDLYGLQRAMLTGALRNLLHTEEENHLNLADDCWYGAYMAGTTFDENKIYLLAGDLFLDIIREAWVLYVNTARYEEACTDVLGDIDALYALVKDGEWDYATLAMLAERAHRDTATPGVTDESDEQVGLVTNHMLDRISLYTSGLSIFDFSGASPRIKADSSALTPLCNAFAKMYKTAGVLHFTKEDAQTASAHSAIVYFLNDTSVFCLAQLGELESEAVRESTFKKGLVPYPKYDAELQEEYHTLVHDQAELGAILSTTSAFPAATAYLQYMGELSVPVLQEYYENALKIKYSDLRGTREMIDLVHDGIDSPFDFLLGRMCWTDYAKTEELFIFMLQDAQNDANGFASNYAANYTVWQQGLNAMLEKTNDLE